MNTRRSLDDIIAAQRDTRTVSEMARDHNLSNISDQLAGARAHKRWIELNSTNELALKIANDRLADAEASARAVGLEV